MTSEPDAEALRATLRRGLTAALKTRDADALAALRSAIATIDNAQAVPAPDTEPPISSAQIAGAQIAGARAGAGSTEAARRELGSSELLDILRGQITEYNREADRYEALGLADTAARLRRQAGLSRPTSGKHGTCQRRAPTPQSATSDRHLRPAPGTVPQNPLL